MLMQNGNFSIFVLLFFPTGLQLFSEELLSFKKDDFLGVTLDVEG